MRNKGWMAVVWALVPFMGMALASVVGDLATWRIVAGNGSWVEPLSDNEAVFVIRRAVGGPKRDVATHGYAYLQSPPIPLPAGWRHIEISGEWWREPARRSNYPELVLRVYARPPRLDHGDARDGVRETNVVHVGLRSWKPAMYVREVGRRPEERRGGAIRSRFPEAPTGFMLSIFRLHDGRVIWLFHQRRGTGDWHKVFSVTDSRLFDGTTAREIHVRIGGWTTWDQPIANRLHVRDVAIRVSTWSAEGDLPGNFELNALSGTGGEAPGRVGTGAR